MSIASFSVKQPVLVNLLSIFSLIMGGMVLKDMTRESIPAVPTGWCQVITLVPGASAEEVEQLVTVPLETAAGGVDNIDQMFSTSREGLSTVIVEFNLEVKINDAAQDARSKISAIRSFSSMRRRSILARASMP